MVSIKMVSEHFIKIVGILFEITIEYISKKV